MTLAIGKYANALGSKGHDGEREVVCGKARMSVWENDSSGFDHNRFDIG